MGGGVPSEQRVGEEMGWGGRGSQRVGGRREGGEIGARGGEGVGSAAVGGGGGGGGGRKGTATTMGAGGCSMGLKRSPEVGDGGGDR